MLPTQSPRTPPPTADMAPNAVRQAQHPAVAATDGADAVQRAGDACRTVTAASLLERTEWEATTSGQLACSQSATSGRNGGKHAKAAFVSCNSSAAPTCAVVTVEDFLAPLVSQVQALLGGAQHAKRLLRCTRRTGEPSLIASAGNVQHAQQGWRDEPELWEGTVSQANAGSTPYPNHVPASLVGLGLPSTAATIIFPQCNPTAHLHLQPNRQVVLAAVSIAHHHRAACRAGMKQAGAVGRLVARASVH